uniref:WAT1-related protein n=1 Tax=Davidia involucrata TaxID=16924 RepID=A0A5B7A061_DAVIN
MKALLRLVKAMEKHKPYIAMIFIQFVYTGMSIFSKAAISEGGMKSSVFVAYRQGFATLALAPFAFFFERKKSPPLSCNLLCKIFFVSLCGITLSLNLYYFGMNYTSATFATAITNTIPAMVFIMAIVSRMESVSLTQWHGIAKVLGSAVGISGAMVFTFYKGPSIYHGIENENPDPSTTYSKGDWTKGALLMLAANLTWSLWLIMQRPIVQQYPAKLRLTTLQCFFSCMMSSLWAVLKDRNLSSWKLGWDINLLSVIYCGVIVTGITYWLQVWVVEKKGPVFTAVFSPLALILTAIFSAILFKETLHWGSVCGALLLVGGLYSFLWGNYKEGKSKTNEQKPETKGEAPTSECV